MAFIENDKMLASKTNEVNGFADMSMTIREAAELIKMPGGSNMVQDAKNISSTFAALKALILNAEGKSRVIAAEYEKKILAMYLYIASGIYNGTDMCWDLCTFESADELEKEQIEDLKYFEINGHADTGFEKVSDKILRIYMGNEKVGLYYPGWMAFIPGIKFTEKLIAADGLMNDPHVICRCRAMLTNMLVPGKKTEQRVILNVLNHIGGPLSGVEMKKYYSEEAKAIPEEICDYIRKVSPSADCSAVCLSMGKREKGKLLEAPVFAYTESAPMNFRNRSYRKIANNLVILPPAKDVSDISNVSYECGPEDGDGIPAWLEFTAELDGNLYHRIYVNRGTSSFKFCEPDNIIDLVYNVPDDILEKYNYLIQGSAASAFSDNDLQTEWKVYPEDQMSQEIPLESVQFPGGKWKILQRSCRIDRMELIETGTGKILAAVVPEKSPAFKKSPQHLYVSLDPAGSTTVRLESIAGTGVSKEVAFTEMCYPLTPMAKKDFDMAAERRMVPDRRSGTHFDSLLQKFSAAAAGAYANLQVDNRPWLPDETLFWQALKNSPGTMTQALAQLGVVGNMKELLTHSNLNPNTRQEITDAFRKYVGSLLLESVLSAYRRGFGVEQGNLELLISYPDNGSEEGITKEMQGILHGALAYVNEYMNGNSQLVPDRNVFFCSESEAAAIWQQLNSKNASFISPSVAAGTSDIGHSTFDFSLRVNNKIYTVSVPYAAMHITTASLAKIYQANANALMKCFVGINPEMAKAALATLQATMNCNQGKLYERLGFILTLNRLFSSASFNVTGPVADEYQTKFQELTEAKLNILIPAYASVIIRALKDGSIKPDDDILLAPVGKGSLSLNNTAQGFKDRWILRLNSEINYQIETDGSFSEKTAFTGQITLLANIDKDKRSVAEGMIGLKNNPAKKAKAVPAADPTEHYLDIVYGTGDAADHEGREKFMAYFAALQRPSMKAALNSAKSKLYDDAFNELVKAYTFDKFDDGFERFLYTGIDQGIPVTEMGILDADIRQTVSTQFQNLMAQLRSEYKDLVMSCPFIEEEMMTGALLDLAIERLNLFSRKQGGGLNG